MGKHLQQELKFKSWGGRREGAGRKRNPKSGVWHVARPRHAARHPLHVTLKLKRELGNLRTKVKAHTIRSVLVLTCCGDGFRIIDFSIQRDHIHMNVEAASREHLSRGMQGFCIRVARRLNRKLARKGAVFADRYHARALKSPREVRNARAYVANNARRHAAQRGVRNPGPAIDQFSSWAWFDGWRDCPRSWIRQARSSHEAERPVAEARTWLMRVGWRRRGLVSLTEVPGGCRKR